MQITVKPVTAPSSGCKLDSAYCIQRLLCASSKAAKLWLVLCPAGADQQVPTRRALSRPTTVSPWR